MRVGSQQVHSSPAFRVWRLCDLKINYLTTNPFPVTCFELREYHNHRFGFEPYSGLPLIVKRSV